MLMKKLILYKYTQKRFADDFFRDGSLRIGTFEYFRDVERKLSDEIRDEFEAYSIRDCINTSGKALSSLHDGVFSEHISDFIKITGKNVNVILENGASINIARSHRNAYLFCMTTIFNKSKMKKMGYDACFEILDTKKFFNEITFALPKDTFYQLEGNVIYRQRNVAYDSHSDVHPYLNKPEYPRFVEQQEYRCVWGSHLETLPKFLDIKVPNARRYCKRIV